LRKGLEMVSTKNRWTPCRSQEGSRRRVRQTLTLRVVRLVIDQRTRQFCRQRRRLRLPAYRLLGRGRSCSLKLRLDGGDIGIDHLVQQVELVDIELFSRQGKAVAPQDGDLMAQPLVECFQAVKSLVQARSVEAIV
ncbi:hypothetical protein, partial [Pseudomonas sp. PIC25]|uniref:hypothetical protein n=1 Tax=Pseudomonas sp. PIC25 TaxID=1958773 RepID=UPI001C486171